MNQKVQKQKEEKGKDEKVEEKKSEKVNKKTKKSGKKGINFWIKDILLAIVNVAFIVGLIFVLDQLNAKAKELKTLRDADFKATQQGKLDLTEIDLESSGQRAERLSVLFPDESGLINFVGQIDVLKEEGVVTRFSFASEEAVRDKTGYYGIPFVIEFAGTWDQISSALIRVQNLPNMIRAVNAEVASPAEGDQIVIRYGGFLYVSETFAQNR